MGRFPDDRKRGVPRRVFGDQFGFVGSFGVVGRPMIELIVFGAVLFPTLYLLFRWLHAPERVSPNHPASKAHLLEPEEFRVSVDDRPSQVYRWDFEVPEGWDS